MRRLPGRQWHSCHCHCSCHPYQLLYRIRPGSATSLAWAMEAGPERLARLACSLATGRSRWELGGKATCHAPRQRLVHESPASGTSCQPQGLSGPLGHHSAPRFHTRIASPSLTGDVTSTCTASGTPGPRHLDGQVPSHPHRDVGGA